MASEVEASRELDARVSEAMGWGRPDPSRSGGCPTCGYSGHYSALPFYSTDDAAALEVVEAMVERGAIMDLKCDNGVWTCDFDFLTHAHGAVAPTLPLAICRAALQASETQPDPLTPEER